VRRDQGNPMDFPISSRGWCYVLEEHGLPNGDFDAPQSLINECRKSGELPLDICAEDEGRAASNLEDLDADDPAAFAQAVSDYVQKAHRHYAPISFWGDLPV
jgi:hypothetical protein